MSNSLWGEDFIVEDKTKKILDKVNKPKKVKSEKINIKSKKIPIDEKLRLIKENVLAILGVYVNDTIVIKTIDELSNYIDKAISNGIIAIDTETNNSLDPLTCKLMGGCIYTPRMKNAYIPINHINYKTQERLDWQLTEEDIKNQFNRLNENNVKIIAHNGKFDYKVLACTCGYKMSIYWDTLIGARMLNENEKAGLKYQYISKIDPSIEKYSIDHLFDIEYAVVDPEIFALYAATDSFMTYRLYEYQEREFSKEDNKRLYDVFYNVEMKVLPVVISMELNGISLDTEYCKRLSKKYHDQLEEINKKLETELGTYNEKIASWRLTDEANFKIKSGIDKKGNIKYKKSKNEQLKDPVELTSPTQLSILLYDILNIGVIDEKTPRGTGKEILEQINLPLVKLILEQRGVLKLLDAFIDTLPEQVSSRDGKIHSSFNQLGTDTGRFSCSKPNLQQIPARNVEIRMMFCASEGKTLIGSDYSQQEPRCLTAFSRDRKLLDSYNANRDLYATLGSGVYKNDYWDNMEHYEDGTDNLEGKKRRKKMKTLYLGMSYGMGPKKLSEDMKCSLKEANKIVDDFHKGFPEVSKWMQETEDEACIKGYVEDFWGRRRRLPDLLLPEYTFEYTKNNFNPLLKTQGSFENTALYEKYKSKLDNIKRFEEYEPIKNQALAEGLKIIKNGGFISRSKRQCVNARIQGSAATMTKKAMIAIYNDKQMRSYGFNLLIGVHDELIGECYESCSKEASERLVYLMKSCVPEIDVPLKCDPTIEKHWYEEEYASHIYSEYENGKSINDICEEHPECTETQIKKYLE